MNINLSAVKWNFQESYLPEKGFFKTDKNKKRSATFVADLFFKIHFQSWLKSAFNLSLFPVGLSIIRSLSLFTRVFFMGIFVSLRIFPM